MSLDGQVSSEETLGVDPEALIAKGFKQLNRTYLVKDMNGYVEIYKRNEDDTFSLHRWGFLNKVNRRQQ